MFLILLTSVKTELVLYLQRSHLWQSCCIPLQQLVHMFLTKWPLAVLYCPAMFIVSPCKMRQSINTSYMSFAQVVLIIRELITTTQTIHTKDRVCFFVVLGV